ncbi:MAG TPA: glutamate 5-kinase [bacterium]
MKPKKERLVIKVGTSVLTQSNQKLDYNVIHQIVEQIGTLRAEGHQVLLVSSGAAGASHGLADFASQHRSLVRKQLMTAVGQPRLMSVYTDFFREHQITVAQALLTRHDFGDRERYLGIRNVMEGLLELDVLPILNENDVVADEALTFGDNDYLAAAVAPTISANRLFLLTVGDGFYAGGDPKENPSAKLLHEVAEITQAMWESCQATLSRGGSGGMLSKLKAADMATSFGIETHIVSGKVPNIVLKVMNGERHGTRFLPTVAKRLKGYRQWLRFGALTNGRIYIDAGAEKALANNKSLLPAGISRAEGTFQPGDVVEIFGAGEEKLGVGLINFSADDLNAMLAGTREVARSTEAIHKDRLLLA